MKQITSIDLAAEKNVTPQRVTKVLGELTMLLSANPMTEAGRKEQDKRIQRRLDWLGSNYVSHQKIGGNYIITVKQ